jgi:hypothetical protein
MVNDDLGLKGSHQHEAIEDHESCQAKLQKRRKFQGGNKTPEEINGTFAKTPFHLLHCTI